MSGHAASYYGPSQSHLHHAWTRVEDAPSSSSLPQYTSPYSSSYHVPEQTPQPYGKSVPLARLLSFQVDANFSLVAAQPPLSPLTTRQRTSAVQGQYREHHSGWVFAFILILTFLSTALSGIYFVIAIMAPRWGKYISSHGLSLSTANVLIQLFAKLIEMTFVTAFIAFLGQKFTRKALRATGGVTVAEMGMRDWIMQPGSILLQQARSVKYAGWSWIGVLTLVAALASVLYTTAASALSKMMGPS
jgi:hypothetical protein